MGEALVTAFTVGFTAVADDVASMLGAMVPIAIGIAGSLFVVKKGMSWFKSLAK